VHCITLYESVGNPGHSSRSLRNHISFAMQIVVRNGHLNSSGPKPGHQGVCVGMGPHGGPGPSPGPRQPDSLVSGPLALPVYAKNMASASSSCFPSTRRIHPPSSRWAHSSRRGQNTSVLKVLAAVYLALVWGGGR
jgi:hypothetical protein